nr:ORFa [Heliothis subflexa]
MSKSESKKDVKEVEKYEEETPLSVILKFIKPFNGDRDRLTAFLRNCDSAIELASSHQEDIVFKYILSQLEGKAESACSIKDFDTWSSLKSFLKNQFGERKHYSHLLTDLQDCKQGIQENVSQFSLRVETCLQKLLTEVTVSNSKKSELTGRLATMEDLALHTFTLGLHPRIANLVRSRDPKNLNDAINYAISEEKIQQSIFRNNTNKLKPVEPTPRRNDFNNRTQQKSTYYNAQRAPFLKDSPFCRYCKKFGHVIEQCQLREYNNKRFADRIQPFTPSQPSPSTSRSLPFKDKYRVNFTETNEEEESRDEVDEPTENLN